MEETCPAGTAAVVRGVSRLLFHRGSVAIAEASLRNGRRADLMAIDAKGQITIVEIKVARADLLGDRKWPDYLDFCDRFFWAVPGGFDLALFEREDLQPGRAGLIVADSYTAAVVCEATHHPLNAARRRAETLRFARRAAGRLLMLNDPHIEGFD